MSDQPLRQIRSFVMRTGRMTPGQEKALAEQWPDYGLAADGQPLDLPGVFGRDAPVVLEIGFGMGDSLLTQAMDNPDQDYLGIEVHLPGVGRLIKRAHDAGVTNLRVMREDAVDILRHQIADNSLSTVQVFFPDPWHKKKHHKRRLIQPDFVALVGHKLKPGGLLHLATDWGHYAEHMMTVMSASTDFYNAQGPGQFTPGRPDFRPETKFERRGQNKGHPVWDLLFRTYHIDALHSND